jgi:hypothetical protein
LQQLPSLVDLLGIERVDEPARTAAAKQKFNRHPNDYYGNTQNEKYN